MAAVQLEKWVVDNYEALVAEGRRTYESIAKFAEEAGDKVLAAWAHARHEATTPAEKPATKTAAKQSAKPASNAATPAA